MKTPKYRFSKKMRNSLKTSPFYEIWQKQQKIVILEENRDFAQRLFKIAKLDLDVSQLLFENNYFTHAIYQLQQATEKLCKSMLLISGQAIREDLRTHDSFIIAIEKSYPAHKAIFDEIEKKIPSIDFANNIPKLKKRYLHLKNISSILIDSTLDEIAESERLYATQKGLIEVVDKLVKPQFPTIPLGQIRKIVKDDMANTKNGAQLMIRNAKILCLATFLLPHSNSPRYPTDEPTRPFGFESYDENLGVISSYTRLVEHTLDAIQKSEDIFQKR